MHLTACTSHLSLHTQWEDLVSEHFKAKCGGLVPEHRASIDFMTHRGLPTPSESISPHLTQYDNHCLNEPYRLLRLPSTHCLSRLRCVIYKYIRPYTAIYCHTRLYMPWCLDCTHADRCTALCNTSYNMVFLIYIRPYRQDRALDRKRKDNDGIPGHDRQGRCAVRWRP